jgi:hypothetical protein
MGSIFSTLATERFSDRRLGIVAGAWTATRSWIVTGVTDDEAAADATVPHGDPHPLNGNMHVADRTVVRFKGPLVYLVTATYRFGDVGGGYSDPTMEPTQILPDLQEDGGPSEVDSYKNPVVNSAGNPYDPAAGTIFTQTATFTARKVLPFYDISVAMAVMNHVNAAPFTIANFGTADKYQAYCFYYRPAQAYTKLSPYVLVEAKIGVRPGDNPWAPRIVDKGKWGWYFDTEFAIEVKGQFCNKAGVLYDSDVLLDGTGKPIDPQWYVSDGAGNAIAPVKNPSLPSGLSIDSELSSAHVTQLVWNNLFAADFSGLE